MAQTQSIARLSKIQIGVAYLAWRKHPAPYRVRGPLVFGGSFIIFDRRK